MRDNFLNGTIYNDVVGVFFYFAFQMVNSANKQHKMHKYTITTKFSVDTLQKISC